jgi:uncharacterized protein (TIGR02246 family)
MEPDERAIRQVHSTWVDAANAGDLARLLTLMADDVVFLNPGRAPFGRDGFPPGFLSAHERFRIRCISELEEVVVVGEVAYTRARDSLSVTPRSTSTSSGQAGPQVTQEGATQAETIQEEATQLAGHRMTIYRKQPDGRWLLARDAHTLSPVKT